LGVVSAAAMALALLHGPLIAVLGQAAAFAVPALVGGAEPFAPGLFAYVLAVAVGALALARYRDWRWTTWIPPPPPPPWAPLLLGGGGGRGGSRWVGAGP